MKKNLSLSTAREQIAEAYRLIDPAFKDSPKLVSETLSAMIKGAVTLKIETINPIGCFKGRGTDYLFTRRAGEFHSGVVAASAGNFGQGLAYAARKHKTSCCVFAPTNANTLKIEKMRAFGAEVILYGNDFDEAKAQAKKWASDNGSVFVEDGCEPEIAIGAGTIGLELFEHGARWDSIVVPLGNGSLISGIAKWVKAVSPATRVIGVCAEGAPAMALSFQNKSCTQTESANTIADGIAVRVPVREVLEDLYELVDEVLLVSDDQIKKAMQLLLRVHRLLIEPAGAVGVAAILCNPEYFHAKRVAVPLCGANLSDSQIKDWLSSSETVT